MKTISLLGLALFALSSAHSQTAPSARPQLNLMPWPANVQTGSGQLIVKQDFTIAMSSSRDARVQAAAERFVFRLSHQTGIPLRFTLTKSGTATLAIRAERSGEKIQKLGEDESYVLDVNEAGAKLIAPNPLGVIHGLQTLLQLAAPGPQGFAFPAVHIEDAPRFPWRGLLLDAGRHWMPVPVVKRTLDGMEAVKMNVLHFHLSEYQGFRVESKKYPKLQELGSNGQYYTQDEIKELIAYARDRGIRVMPEFDMPGHSQSWFVGYPELASGPGPYQIEKRWGIFDPAMDPTRDSTYKFLDKFIGEMAHLFPDEFFHLGGDEVNGKQWDANPKIQEFMKAHDLKSNNDLQTYFNQHVVKIITKHKKTAVGWDEVLQPALPKDVVVQSWRGQQSEAQAVRAGHRALLSHGYYLDLAEPAAQHYLVDPLSGDAATLPPDQQKMILGGEACMWSEMVTAENVDSRIWPRNAAIAERLWSPQNVNDVAWMYRRLEVISDWLDSAGLTHHAALRVMRERLAPERVDPLSVLADVVEPVKRYTRSSSGKYDADTPLNRLPDSVPPESRVARDFAALVDQIVAGSASPDQIAAARQWMTAWKYNDERLAPALNSQLLSEDAGISRDLSTLGNMGLQALDLMAANQPAPPGWREQQISQMEPMKKPKPQSELLLMVVAPVEKLVQAVK
jgi:hexosaminidase